VLATIPTDFSPQVMADFAGSIWVTNLDGNTVTEIDPDTNRVAGSVDTEVSPDGIVQLAGSIWIATDYGPLLQRVDPATRAVTGTFAVSDQGSINANQLVAAAGGALWFPLLDSGTVVKVGVPAG
jgi:YVTN family beta-propeller protein